MTIVEIRDVLSKEYNDITFVVDGFDCGINTEVNDGIPKYHAWCNDRVNQYYNVDALLIDDFFNGRSLVKMAGKVEFTVY